MFYHKHRVIAKLSALSETFIFQLQKLTRVCVTCCVCREQRARGQPIRGQYPSHVLTLSQSESGVRMVKLNEDMIVARTRVSDMNQVKKLNCWGAELSDIAVIKKLRNVEVLSLR